MSQEMWASLMRSPELSLRRVFQLFFLSFFFLGLFAGFPFLTFFFIFSRFCLLWCHSFLAEMGSVSAKGCPEYAEP